MIFLTQPSLIIQYIMISFDIDLIYYKGPRIKNKTTFFSFRSPWTCDLNTYSKNIGTRNWDINCTTKELVIIFFLVLYFRVFQMIFWRQLQKKNVRLQALAIFVKIPVSVEKMNETSLMVALNKEAPVISTL